MESELMLEALTVHKKKIDTAKRPAEFMKRVLYNKAFRLYTLNRRQRDFENDAASRSLDAPPPDARGQRASAPLVECLPDEKYLDLTEALELKIRREAVLNALSVSPRLQTFTAMYMDGIPQADLARYFNISHERARQMLSQAVKTARKQLGIDFEGNPISRKPRKQHLPL
jgi:DNA-directed RNA polymerase specialized sigma24 family protein